jgi:thymidylate synthase ThyX
VYRQAIRAKAFDALRGLLPAASLSNVGIYGTGQGFEQLLLRMRSMQLPEAQDYAAMMLTELRKVMPSFLKRVDLDDRGVVWSRYLSDNREAMSDLAAKLLGDEEPEPAGDSKVALIDFDPDGEDKLIAAMLYAYSDLPEHRIEAAVRGMSADDRMAVVTAYVGDRTNRRHKPGRALERLSYRFDVLSDYGAFRDLQRHRLLTIEWQDLSPRHGFVRPEVVADAGAMDAYDEAMDVSRQLYDDLREPFPHQAPYAVALAYRVRYVMQMNAREAMHLLELRSAPQGHPSYRDVAQDMHHLIGEVAGHRAVAAMMKFVDHSDEADLERLASERRAAARKASARPR